MSCLLDDIMESVISCVSAKETWTDLVHSFEGPSDTKENRIMDLKLEYQTFKAKSTESLSQTYTHCKTLLNELANDGVNLSKHEINVGFMNSLLEKCLTFSQGLRNANHTQTLDLADIYERFFYEDNLIQRSPSSPQNLKTLQPKNKGLVSEIFVWDEEEVSDDEEVTHVKVLMALADDELAVRKIHARNGEWVEITIRKVNTILSMDKDADCQNYLKNGFKTKDWVERLNPNSKLLNFNTGRILVPESQVVNESLETLNTPESSKDSEAEFLTLLPPLKNLQGASPSSEVRPLTFQPHSPKERPGLGIMKHIKPETQNSFDKIVSGTVIVSETKQITPSVPTEVRDIKQESKLNKLTKLVQMLSDEKVNSNPQTQESTSKIQKTESSK
nr:retrovirus-related Pol polyprotein from transposon TNT 1-94 [Tanacetum cinerariifolium]